MADKCPNEVLIVNVDNPTNKVLLEVLATKGIRGIVAEDYRSGLELLDRRQCDMVLIDLEHICRPSGSKGAFIDQYRIRQLRESHPELPLVLLISRKELSVLIGADDDGQPDDRLIQLTADLVSHAVALGINGFLCKPLCHMDALDMIERFLPVKQVSVLAQAEAACGLPFKIVGRSKVMLKTVELAKRIAATTAPVLILGESGTGKELVAHLIHCSSMRASGSYIRVNCAALSESLLDSELFGHEKGAFTGALALYKGRFERANGGTILLDEITETPPRFQAKLLRVLEQQELERVGGGQSIRVNVRVISTTNTDIVEQVRSGRFRQDLYYRLCGAKLTVPALRERVEDLEDLVWHFVNMYAKECGRTITALDPATMDIFRRYDWPGNVRQLRNVVRTCLIFGTGLVLKLTEVGWLMDGARAHTQAKIDDQFSLSSRRYPNVEGPLGISGMPLEDIERIAILETLTKTGGNRKKAAGLLGISDRTLREKIRRYREHFKGEPMYQVAKQGI